MKTRILLLTVLAISCKPDIQPEIKRADYDITTELSGGKGTIFLESSHAYSQPIGGLSEAEVRKHDAGDVLFESNFVSGGSEVRTGLGPLFNNISCNACHPSDGRSIFPKELNAPSGFFLRISSGNDLINGPIGAPGFGGQLQQVAIRGNVPEVKFGVTFIDRTVTLAGGDVVVLKKPEYSVYDSYIPLPDKYELSPRIGMPVFGLGLLEAIPEATIMSYADPDDVNGDGISGRANYVWDSVKGQTSLGRFGWKANTASIMEQCAAAMVNDMGLTNPIFPTDPSRGQSNGDNEDHTTTSITQSELDVVAFYCQTLGVPARRRIMNPEVQRGEELFNTIGCALCHIPTMKTGKSEIAALSEQTIHAFTDMLLHDMGEGLADNRADFLANGQEWKTRPLWGLGLNLTVNNHENLLHDGRAKSIEEAILWHGGEAQSAQTKYRELPKEDRKALESFLRSL